MIMAISDEITRLQQAKADLKTAIENKGVTVSSSATLDDYADLVDSIEVGGGDSEMNCVYKEITVEGNQYVMTFHQIIAPIRDKLVIVRAKNTSTSYITSITVRTETIDTYFYWYYSFTIPANGDVLIICDPNTETASLYSFDRSSSIAYYGSGGAND